MRKYDESEFFDEMIKLDRLDLYYEAHLVGLEGENFEYNVYFDEIDIESKLGEVQTAVDTFTEEFNDAGIYPGYLDVSFEEGKIFIYQDIGGEMYEDDNAPIHGLLRALNSVPGIKMVLINEEPEF